MAPLNLGVFGYVFDSETRQRGDIEGLRAAGARLARRSAGARRQTEERLSELEQQVGELTLLCKALVATLHQRGGIDPAELEAAARAIDAEDGVVDGRVTPEVDRRSPAQRARDARRAADDAAARKLKAPRPRKKR